MHVLRSIASVTPLQDNEVNELGVRSLECLCEDLVPPSVLAEETVEVEKHAAPLPSQEDFGLLDELSTEAEVLAASLQPDDSIPTSSSHANSGILLEKPKRKWARKIYPTSAVRRSARIKIKHKFHDKK